MSVAKVKEITFECTQMIKNDEPELYRVNMKLTFVLDD